jgi:streptogramin lyase
MKTLIGATATALLLGVPMLAMTGLSTSAGTEAGTCVSAKIAGRHVCLKVGARCQKQHQRAYRKRGFTCIQGLLRRIPRLVTDLALPTASPLPAAAHTITLQTKYPAVGELAATSGAVWTAGGPFRIDASGGTVTGPFTSGESNDIGAGDGSMWASDYDNDLVRRFDAGTGKLQATIQLPHGSSPEGITDSGGAIWVATHHGGTLVRIDPATNVVAANVKVTYAGTSGPQGDAFGFGSVWVDVPNIGAVVRVDPQTNKIQAKITFPIAMSPCGGIAVTATAIWVTGCLDGTDIARIDPSTDTVTKVFNVRGRMWQPAANGDTVWFVEGGDPDLSPAAASLVHLDPTGHVLARYELPKGFISGGAIVVSGSVWISDFSHARVIHFPTKAS